MAPPTLRLAAYALGISGLLHLITPVFAGMVSPVPAMLAIGVLYLVIATFFHEAPGWSVWPIKIVVFWMMLIGGGAALGNSFDPGAVPGWLYLAIFAADALAALGLFVEVWRGRSEPA